MRDLVVIGVGELGKLLGGGALRAGLRVTPVTRNQQPAEVLREVPPGTPVLLSVGEEALDGLLGALPSAHRGALILLQNELFPSVYRAHGLTPTVLVPWLLQKPGMPTIVARTSAVHGAQAALVGALCAALALPVTELASAAELHQALVDKYAFILTSNALGLLADRTLGTWLQEDPAQVWDICDEAAELGQALVEARVERAQARRATQEAMVALSHVPARGRTAGPRLTRALAHAIRLGLSLPALTRAAQKAGG